jgi:hypothetical protein
MHQSGQGNSEHAKLEWVKIALIGTDGKYIGDPLVKDESTPVSGGRLGVMYPQLATAVSLRTDKKRGPGAYGRFYAPLALPIGNDGRVTESVADTFVQFMQSFLDGINTDLANLDMDNDIFLGNVSKVGSGSQDAITGVFVGNLVDTQRRRRNKLQEQYKGYELQRL